MKQKLVLRTFTTWRQW